MGKPLPDPASMVALTSVDGEIERSRAFRQRMADRLNGKRTQPPRLPSLQTTQKSGRIHLVIGDSHASPAHANQRYDVLGRFIAALKPDVVVDIGDWFSMDSLGSWNLPGSKTFEGQRYHLDIEAGIDAMERVQWRTRGMRNKPRYVRTLGNHEHRISRFLENSPRMEGLLGYHDLMSAEFGWEEHAYTVPVDVDGLLYCHEFRSGNGQYGAANVGRREGRAAVYGHTHRRQQFDVAGSIEGSRRTVLNCGCFFTHREDYAGVDNAASWWRGLLVLRDVQDGEIGSIEWHSIESLFRDFGK